VVGVAGIMAVVLSSCFALTGFVILDSSLSPGQSTKARFTVRPYVPDTDKFFQFFLVGTSAPDDIGVGKGVWGANGKFGGPDQMDNHANLASELEASGDCSGGGLDFSAVYGSLTWRGYATAKKVGGGDVNKVATVEINVKAKSGADHDISVNVMGITGAWDDDGDGVPEDDQDTFYCTGNATTNIWVN